MRMKHVGVAFALVSALVTTGAFVSPAAGEPHSRALERVLSKGMFNAEESTRLQRSFAAARKAGVDERDALTLVEAGVEGEFDAAQTLRILSIAAQMALEELPVEGYIAKIEEGVSKRVDADRVVQVAERRALMLKQAKQIINSLVLEGFSVDERDDVLPDLAAALEAGRNPEEARAILAGALRDGDGAGTIRRKLFP